MSPGAFNASARKIDIVRRPANNDRGGSAAVESQLNHKGEDKRKS